MLVTDIMVSFFCMSVTIAVISVVGLVSAAPSAIVAHLRTFSIVAASFVRTACRNVGVDPLTAANTVWASSRSAFFLRASRCWSENPPQVG